jgi:hypothetical protein
MSNEKLNGSNKRQHEQPSRKYNTRILLLTNNTNSVKLLDILSRLLFTYLFLL